MAQKNVTRDMTQGSPLKLILTFSLPLLGGFLFQQLYSFMDTMVVGGVLGTEALAAVGDTGSLNFLINGFCMGICSGFAIPIAQAFGAKDETEMRRYVMHSVYLCAVISVLMGLLTNLTQCLRYVFQCTNLTRISSLADLIAKGLLILCMAVALLFGVDYSLPFILSYIGCQAVALAYVLVCARSILQFKANFRGTLRLCIDDIAAGLKIMVAYYADSLIVGFTRMMTDWHLGLAAFGKLSLSFSLTNFVLTFIGQVSMVAFPVLKRLDADGQREKYLTLRLLLHTVLPFVYLLYVPVNIILGLWLPEYDDSLFYLALTMPLCVYNCKASLLFNNYLKMGRSEGALCLINLATMVLNVVFATVSIVAFESVEMATCGIVCSVALRDLVFELFLAQKFGNDIARVCISEALLAVGFMIASWCLGDGSWLVVLVMLAVFVLLNREGAKLAVSEVGKRIFR